MLFLQSSRFWMRLLVVVLMLGQVFAAEQHARDQEAIARFDEREGELLGKNAELRQKIRDEADREWRMSLHRLNAVRRVNLQRQLGQKAVVIHIWTDTTTVSSSGRPVRIWTDGILICPPHHASR